MAHVVKAQPVTHIGYRMPLKKLAASLIFAR